MTAIHSPVGGVIPMNPGAASALSKVLLGGGCELAPGRDIHVAAEDFTFAIPPERLGLRYDIHGTPNRNKTAGTHPLKETLFTAEPVHVRRTFAATELLLHRNSLCPPIQTSLMESRKKARNGSPKRFHRPQNSSH